MGEVSHVSINNRLNNTQRVVFFIERVVTKCVFISWLYFEMDSVHFVQTCTHHGYLIIGYDPNLTT